MERPPHNDERQGEPGQIIRFPRQWVPLDGIQPLGGARDEAESSDGRGSAGTETLVADFWDSGDTQEFVAGSEAATTRSLNRGEAALRLHHGRGSDVANRSERRRIVALFAVVAVVAIAAGAATLGRNLLLPRTSGTSTPASARTAQRTTAASHETATRGVVAASGGSVSRRNPAQRQRKRAVRHKRGVTGGRRSAPVLAHGHSSSPVQIASVPSQPSSTAAPAPTTAGYHADAVRTTTGTSGSTSHGGSGNTTGSPSTGSRSASPSKAALRSLITGAGTCGCQ